MRIDTEQFGDGAFRVTPHGRIDSNTAADFEAEVMEVVDGCGNIILDLKETEYISSSGLRALLQVKKRIGSDGILKLINVSESVMDVLDMTGFSDMLEVVSTDGPDASDIRVLFFDIDGTLLSHTTGEVPKSTARALSHARERGIKTVIATGRDIEELEKLPVMELYFDGYLTLNGNICLDIDRKMFDGNEIDPGEVEILVSIFRAGRIPFVLIGEKQTYINYVDDIVIQTQQATHGTVPDIGEYRGEKIYQCRAFVDDDVRHKLEDLLDKCTITSWSDTGIDIIAKTGGKASGIHKFLAKEGLARSQAMAFGDGENDIDMIKYVGIGVAMGNGKDELKRAADYVTSSVDEDGIENALIHFGLI